MTNDRLDTPPQDSRRAVFRNVWPVRARTVWTYYKDLCCCFVGPGIGKKKVVRQVTSCIYFWTELPICVPYNFFSRSVKTEPSCWT